MSLIPQTSVTTATLAEWFTAKRDLATLKSKEALLRSTIFKHFFPNANEGSNKAYDDALLGAEFRIVAKVPVTRDIDVGVLEALMPQLREKGIHVSKLIRYKPELELKEYRKLTAEEMHLFDQCLIIKEGTAAVAIEKKTAHDQ